MKKFNLQVLLTVSAVLLAAPVYAEEPAPGDDVDEVVSALTLPADASATAVEKSEKGLATANAAREGGRAFRWETAEAARAAGDARENASEARSKAASQRPDAGRP